MSTPRPRVPALSADRRELTRMCATMERGFSYPAILISLANFADSSYGNDVTDSVCFSIGETPLAVWIDCEDPKDRVQEFGWNPDAPRSATNTPPPRYSVVLLGDGDPDGITRGRPALVGDLVEEFQPSDEEPLLQTDDPADLVAFVIAARLQIEVIDEDAGEASGWGSLLSLLADNASAPLDAMPIIRALASGGQAQIGGGAAPITTIRLVPTKPAFAK